MWTRAALVISSEFRLHVASEGFQGCQCNVQPPPSLLSHHPSGHPGARTMALCGTGMCPATSLPNESPSTFSGQGVPGSSYSLPNLTVGNFRANYLQRQFSADSVWPMKKKRWGNHRRNDGVLEKKKKKLRLSCVPCFTLELWFERTDYWNMIWGETPSDWFSWCKTALLRKRGAMFGCLSVRRSVHVLKPYKTKWNNIFDALKWLSQTHKNIYNIEICTCQEQLYN